MAQRGRGSWLENVIEICNKQYRVNKRARIDKIPTPTSVNARTGKGYFTGKSTVDFTGFTKKGSVAFDTKETSLNYFPFKNVHQHQIDYLKEVHREYSVDAFLLIYFKKKERLFKVSIEQYLDSVEYYQKRGRSSLPYEWFVINAIHINKGKTVYYDYLELEA